MSYRIVIPLAEADVASCGPKAASLAALAAAGLAVPDAFCLPAEVYRRHLLSADLASLAESVTEGADASLLHERIASADLDALVLDALAAAHRTLGGGPVAARSSALAEDTPGHSFAGQHGTYFSSDFSELAQHVLDCWASLWSDRAYGYRERNALDHASAAMAVIVQRLVPADAAGVAFTVDPVTGEPRVVVEACLGIGESLVSGRVAPDRFVFSRPELVLVDREIAPKTLRLTSDGTGPVREVSVAPRDASLPAITDAQAAEVAGIALAAERVVGGPADTEWALQGTRLWLLQARPVTTSVVPRLPTGYRPTIWSNVNAGEVLPDVVTPMTWSVIGPLASGFVDALLGRLGVHVEIDRLTTLIGGRCYFNATLLGSAFDQIPMVGGGRGVTGIFGGMEASAELLPVLRLPPAEADVAKVSRVRALLGIPVVAIWMLRHTPARARRFIESTRAGTLTFRRRLAEARSEAQTAALVGDSVATLLGMTHMLGFTGVGMMQYGSLSAMTRRWLGDESGTLANRLLAGQGGVDSAEAGLALARLASLARSEAVVAGAVAGPGGWAAVRERLEAVATTTPGTALLLEAWAAFMAEHGHHARGELELATPRWAEQPDDVLETVRALMSAPEATDLAIAHERRAAEAAQTEADIRRHLDPVRRAAFRWTLEQARLGARTRENVKNEGVRSLAAGRQALLALGGHMTARRLLAHPDDIFFLRFAELDAVRSGRTDARPLVAARRAQYERDLALAPPPVVVGEWDGRGFTVQPAEGDELHGLPVSHGVARGRARVIRSLRDGERVRPGEILVAPFTDPGWTPYFVPAAAIVVDMGGLLSHGSIIAREYGLPAVVNVGPATATIRTGDLIEVDGDSGTVRILERAE
ncbi:MAG: hypothetical protein C0418_05360 [Coriobacteriaceae bacterium]|nr:hypothetical protein [Coriobacteriaceae bacterium]